MLPDKTHRSPPSFDRPSFRNDDLSLCRGPNGLADPRDAPLSNDRTSLPPPLFRHRIHERQILNPLDIIGVMSHKGELVNKRCARNQTVSQRKTLLLA